MSRLRQRWARPTCLAWGTMEGYYTLDDGSDKLLILLSFLSKAEGPIPSATSQFFIEWKQTYSVPMRLSPHKYTPNHLVDVGGFLWRSEGSDASARRNQCSSSMW
jgi:hypothetical protein